MQTLERRLAAVRIDVNRSTKPRDRGITVVLDMGLGATQIADLCTTAGSWLDYAKLAWGSALITDQLSEKIQTYRRFQVCPILGGTLFEYAYLHGRLEELLALAHDLALHVEISDGVVNVPRADKLRWIERFARQGEVFSEVGGKTYQVAGDWKTLINEELAAGARKVVVEGREIGPPGQAIRADLVDMLLDVVPPSVLIFEALERQQQVWLIKRLGPNVNLGNVLPTDLMTLESFRQGLKEHTLLHASDWYADARGVGPTPQGDKAP